MKNAAPAPERTAIAATGSAPASIAGRARRLPVAWASAVTIPRISPSHSGLGTLAPESCGGPSTASTIPATISATPAPCVRLITSSRKT